MFGAPKYAYLAKYAGSEFQNIWFGLYHTWIGSRSVDKSAIWFGFLITYFDRFLERGGGVPAVVGLSILCEIFKMPTKGMTVAKHLCNKIKVILYFILQSFPH